MKIVELLVDDLLLDDMEVGIDGIALVNRPAHEENWLAFNKEVEKKQPHEVLDTEQMLELARLLVNIGESEEDLEAEGYEVYRIEELDKEYFVGDINSTPNATSSEDYAGVRIRYKYVGPRDGKNRDFCREMVTANKVYRIEDIQRMTAESVNEEFGYYDIFKWRGSYNCRHRWVKVIYKGKDVSKSYADNMILNNASKRRNYERSEDIPQESTETEATANNARVRLSTQDFAQVGTLDGAPLYDSREEAEQVSRIQGCGGIIHIHKMDGKDLYMPCNHPEKFEELYDVPQYARDKACKARKYKEENPDVDCGTRVGWTRSAQLCNGDKVSRDIIARMSAFGRHLANAEKQESYDEGCALLMVDAWGGKEGIEWAKGELERIDREEFEDDLSDACWPGYEAIGTKIVNGRKVPNCVPKENMDIDVSGLNPYKVQTGSTISENLYFNKEGKEELMKFSLDEEKMEITGAALVPDKLIIRSNALGQPYYVYFSKETIKKLAYKFMKEGRTQATNIEHTSTKAKDTYVAQSWIVDYEDTDKASALGLDYPEGTWVITMKTDDPKVWSEIKEGKYKGFSVEGFFEEKVVLSKDDYLLDNIKTILKSI